MNSLPFWGGSGRGPLYLKPYAQVPSAAGLLAGAVAPGMLGFQDEDVEETNVHAHGVLVRDALLFRFHPYAIVAHEGNEDDGCLCAFKDVVAYLCTCRPCMSVGTIHQTAVAYESAVRDVVVGGSIENAGAVVEVGLVESYHPLVRCAPIAAQGEKHEVVLLVYGSVFHPSVGAEELALVQGQMGIEREAPPHSGNAPACHGGLRRHHAIVRGGGQPRRAGRRW